MEWKWLLTNSLKYQFGYLTCRCWDKDPKNRPAFPEIVKKMEELVQVQGLVSYRYQLNELVCIYLNYYCSFYKSLKFFQQL